MHEIGFKQSSTEPTPIQVDQTSRFQHTYVIGQTGTGKSTWATNSFLQDVHAGHGAAYFDFHGQDAPWLLDHIPPERINDVRYFDPLNPNFVTGYNPFDRVRPGDYSTFTDEIVSSLKHIFSDSWGGRMDDILTNAIRPLFDLPEESKGTLLGAIRVLNDPYYRNWAVRHCSEKSVRDFWLMEFANWSKSDRSHNVNSSLNKIRRFQSSPYLRRVLGQQKSHINFEQAIDEGHILIFDINKWRLEPKNASILASLILSRLTYASTHRAMPSEDQDIVDQVVKPFHIHIDEFHSVTSLALVEVLSGIRKYKVGLTLCHQYTNQLLDEVLEAIKGNVGTKIVFRVGGDDAEKLHKSLDISEPKQLTEQSDYEFTISMKSGNNVHTTHGYSVPHEFERFGYGHSIKRRMASDFASPVSVFEEKYERWQNSRHYGGTIKRETVKKKSDDEIKKTLRNGKEGMSSLGAIMLG